MVGPPGHRPEAPAIEEGRSARLRGGDSRQAVGQDWAQELAAEDEGPVREAAAA